MPPTDDDLDLQLSAAAATSSADRGPTVFVRDAVVAEVQAHAREDLSNELGGVLLGSAASSAEGTLVFVEASIRAQHTDAARGSVTFTHDTWEEINRVKDREHPDKRIVGWYHTHPGFGLFLSSYDQFIHRSFFSLPWQVAWVVDPRAHKDGVFVWQGGELAGPRDVECVGAAGPVTAPATPAVRPEPADSRSPRWVRPLMAALAMIILVQVADIGFLLFSRSRTPRTQEQSMAQIREELSALRGELGSLKLVEPPPPTPVPAPTKPAGETYVVKRGDSLWRIAQRYYGDGDKWGAIAVANGIEWDDLEPGMRLFVPAQDSGTAAGGPGGPVMREEKR